MKQPKKIQLEGKEFILNQLPILKAVCLDKKLISLLLPSLSGLQGFSLDSDIDMSKLTEMISNGLSNMSDEDTMKFFVDLFSTVQVMVPGKPVQEITPDTINTIFEELFSIYKLAFEVMRFNKFAPFALVEGGNAMQTIGGLLNQTKSQKTNPSSSEKLESSPENSNGNGPFGA